MKKLLLLISVFLINLGVFAQLPWETAFSDDFNRADGDLGSDYAPQVSNGTLEIQNNMVIADPDDTFPMYWLVDYNEPLPNKNMRISIDFRAAKESGTTEVMFAIMAKGGQNVSDFSYAALADVTSNYIEISMWDLQGNEETLSEEEFEIESDSLYHIEFIIMGGELEMNITELYSGDEATITYTDDNPLTGSRASINGFQDNDQLIYFDNYQIDTLADNFGVAEVTDSRSEIKIFPNPTGDVINVTTGNQKSEEFSIQIFSMDGRMVFKEFYSFITSESVEIPVQHLSSGVYTVKLNSDRNTAIQRFVKK